MKIAVSGKGGVGKTLVSGTLASYFAQKGFKVMAIDADPSPNLALTLGIPVEEANNIVPISENAELLESKTKTDFPGVFKLHFTVDDIIEDNGMKYGRSCLMGHRAIPGWKRFINGHFWHSKVSGMNRIPKQDK